MPVGLVVEHNSGEDADFLLQPLIAMSVKLVTAALSHSKRHQ